MREKDFGLICLNTWEARLLIMDEVVFHKNCHVLIEVEFIDAWFYAFFKVY